MRLEDGSGAACRQENIRSEAGEKRRMPEDKIDSMNEEEIPKKKRRRLIQTDITDFTKKEPAIPSKEAIETSSAINRTDKIMTEAECGRREKEKIRNEKVEVEQNKNKFECGLVSLINPTNMRIYQDLDLSVARVSPMNPVRVSTIKMIS